MHRACDLHPYPHDECRDESWGVPKRAAACAPRQPNKGCGRKSGQRKRRITGRRRHSPLAAYNPPSLGISCNSAPPHAPKANSNSDRRRRPELVNRTDSVNRTKDTPNNHTFRWHRKSSASTCSRNYLANLICAANPLRKPTSQGHSRAMFHMPPGGFRRSSANLDQCWVE